MDIISNYRTLTLTTAQPEVGPYRVKFTDINTLPNIILSKGDVDVEAVDIALFGRLKLEYGELLNENLVHILEHFNCPQDETVTSSVVPDLKRSMSDLLYTPIVGQLWYNSTTEQIHFWKSREELWFDEILDEHGDIVQDAISQFPVTGELEILYKATDTDLYYRWVTTEYIETSEANNVWIPISDFDDVTASYGTILDGEQIPIPISPFNGIEYTYSDCVWVVSPNGYTDTFAYMKCYADDEANVTMKYNIGDTEISGTANFLIVGIRGNVDLGSYKEPDPPYEPPLIISPAGTLIVTPIDSIVSRIYTNAILSSAGVLTIIPNDSLVIRSQITAIITSNAPNLRMIPDNSTVNGNPQPIDIISYEPGMLQMVPNNSTIGTTTNIVSEERQLKINGVYSNIINNYNTDIISPNDGELEISPTDSVVFAGNNVNIITQNPKNITIQKNDSDVVGINPVGVVMCPLWVHGAYNYNWYDAGPHFLGEFRNDGTVYYPGINLPAPGISFLTAQWIRDLLLPTPFDPSLYTWTINSVSVGGGSDINLVVFMKDNTGYRTRAIAGLSGTLDKEPRFEGDGGNKTAQPSATTTYNVTVNISIAETGTINECHSIALNMNLQMYNW
jgi:hypothetical protein